MKTLVISDLHAPFEHSQALDFLRDLARSIKPDSVVCAGDEVDMHNFSRWQREPEAIGPAEEFAAAKKTLKSLAKLFPRLTIVESNHSWRPWKKAGLAGLLPEFMRSRQAIFETPDGWLWTQAAVVDGVTFIHGEGFSGPSAAIDAAQAYHTPAVIGHIHAHAGIRYLGGPTSLLWGLNVGCLIDVTQPAFSYGKVNRHKPVIGTGAVIDGVPYFFPL